MMTDTAVDSLRQLPSVDRLLGTEDAQELIRAYGRQQTVVALRAAIDAARNAILSGADAPDRALIATQAGARLRQKLAPTLHPVINATGVIIHTNLGRAPLSAETRAAMEAVGRGYSTLEYDLKAGRRGHRTVHAERLLCELTGAEAALIVNNNAGAVLLALTGLAQGRGVVISRGQLVEIGGGFRVPDVMAQSGAQLVEVGTTNRTHLRDYVAAIEPDTGNDVALILQAHHSNFRVIGFTSEPDLEELVALGAEHGLPVMYDLGSGALLETSEFGLAHEPTVQESVVAGADVICFSGDKLLGGTQAGVIVGKAEHVNPLKSHPLTRALRPDKLCLAGLQTTLLHYLKDEALEKIPIWRMISMSLKEIEQRARRWQESLQASGVQARIVDGRSTIGGGSLPGETLPTKLVALEADGPNHLATALRASTPAVVARIENDRLVLDPRTVLPEEEQDLLQAVTRIAKEET